MVEVGVLAAGYFLLAGNLAFLDNSPKNEHDGETPFSCKPVGISADIPRDVGAGLPTRKNDPPFSQERRSETAWIAYLVKRHA